MHAPPNIPILYIMTTIQHASYIFHISIQSISDWNEFQKGTQIEVDAVKVRSLLPRRITMTVTSS